MSQLAALELDDPRWAAFAGSRPEATPFHHPAWSQLLRDCYGFRSLAFGLETEDGLVAGLPVLVVKTLTGKKRWVALPFTDYVETLGSRSDVAELITCLERRRTEGKVSSLEIRSAASVGDGSTCGFRHVLRLGPDVEELLPTFSKTRVQQSIARASREGVIVRVAEHADDLLEIFYGLHLRTRKRLGVPVQPRRFFELLWERVLAKGLGSLLVAEIAGRPAAAAVFLEWNRTVVYKYGASDPALRAAQPNHALLWEAIRRATATGASELDFGRTDLDNEGLRAFKAGWGTEESPLVYTTMGDAGATRESGPLGSMVGFTIKHAPTWVCRALGETLYRYAA